jgi:hypothetical protein
MESRGLVARRQRLHDRYDSRDISRWIARPPMRSSCRRLFSAHSAAKVVNGAHPSPLRFCGHRDCSVTLCVYSLIAVIATASVTHAFSQNNLLAQPRASGSAKRIISSGGRACEAQPSRRGKFFVLQLDTALEALA